MNIVKNLGNAERAVRALAGVILVVGGFFVTGYWKPLAIVVGAGLMFTAAVGY